MITRLDTNGEGVGFFAAMPIDCVETLRISPSAYPETNTVVCRDSAGNTLWSVDGTPEEPVISLGLSHQRATVVRLANAATAPVIIRQASGWLVAVVWPDGRVTREELS